MDSWVLYLILIFWDLPYLSLTLVHSTDNKSLNFNDEEASATLDLCKIPEAKPQKLQLKVGENSQ